MAYPAPHAPGEYAAAAAAQPRTAAPERPGPPPADPAPPVPAATGDGPPPRPRKRRTGTWIAAIVLLGGLGAGGWYVTQPTPTSAAVGDCVTQKGADSLAVVPCGDKAAQFTVDGRVENKTMVDAGLFACAGFPKATSAYWEGREGGTGTVLCLEPVTR